MYICRMHGEPLRYNHQKCQLECPEFAVCGTFITDELIYVRELRLEWLRSRE